MKSFFDDDDRQTSIDVWTVQEELLMDDNRSNPIEASAGSSVTSLMQCPDSFPPRTEYTYTPGNHQDILQEIQPLVSQRRTDDVDVRTFRFTSPTQLPENTSDLEMEDLQESRRNIDVQRTIQDEVFMSYDRPISTGASAGGKVVPDSFPPPVP
jgi:hypothetical protein